MYVDVSAKPKAIVMADEFGYTSTAIHYKHPTARYSILKEGKKGILLNKLPPTQ
jgi:hypothetical protein